MEISEYENIFQNDQNHWWYQSLNRAVLETLHELGVKSPHILDVGCGPGGLSLFLKQNLNCTTVGVDPHPEAIRLSQKRGLTVSPGSFDHYGGFENQKFHVVLATDSLYFLKTNERIREALERVHAHLETDGFFIAQVPAFSCLAGAHDRHVHIERRFTFHDLQDFVDNQQWEVVRWKYRYSFLFPLVWLSRKLSNLRKGSESESGIGAVSPVINRIFTGITRLENLCPVFSHAFGSSLFFILKKKN